MICDFCMGEKNLIWKYESNDFAIGALDVGGVNFRGAWLACDDCSCAIEVDDWDTVIDKALCYSLGQLLGGVPMALAPNDEVKAMRGSLELLYEVFRAVRVGGRVVA